MTRYRAFPPGRGHLRIPLTSRRAALAGLSLYAPCTPRGVWLHRAAWAAVSMLGPRAIPGPASAWEPPVEHEIWRELIDRWTGQVGPFDALAVSQPRQVDRPRAAFTLLAQGHPQAFVKLRRGERDALDNEARALSGMWSFGSRSFAVPEPLGMGTVDEWHYLLMSPLPVGRHHPAMDAPLDEVLADVQAGLADLPRATSLPSHWLPKHGDLAVWNLRRSRAHGLVLVDWEHAGWGPPGTDEVFFRVMSAVLRRTQVPPMPDVEDAVQFWRHQPQFQLGPAENLDHEFVRRARAVLESAG
jgi:hypothetical protein